MGKYKLLVWKKRGLEILPDLLAHRLISLSFSGSNQAREGRLVDALAARGDEGRDTLR